MSSIVTERKRGEKERGNRREERGEEKRKNRGRK